MDDLKFSPFYERLTIPFLVSMVGKILVALLLGLAFLAAHYVSIGNEVFKDWSWFLSVLISTAMLCLYYATHTLRTIFPEMDVRLGPAGDEVYLTPLERILSDRNFVLAGFFFGSVNCLFGLLFGLPHSEGLAVVTILGGYFLAGFVCGMAAFGIYGVTVSINEFSRVKRYFDFTAPDRCGGTLFLGEALIVFGSVTLIVGVMISVYILKVDWANDNTWWITSLKWSWIAFPYVMSLAALIAPVIPLNKALREYKIEREIELQKDLRETRERLEDKQVDGAERQELRQHYEFQQRVRKDLHRMRTWPYDLSANLKYLAVLAGSAYASVDSASKWIRQYFPNVFS